MAQLASAVSAIPYSPARTRRELGKKSPTIVPIGSPAGQAQRTQNTVIAFRGWDLPGPGEGEVVYKEEVTRTDFIELSTGESVSAVKVSKDRSCNVTAPVVNGRAIFELYETLQDQHYGILIGDDRRWISVFVFDPDQYDTELTIQVDMPIAGLAPAPAGEGDARLVLNDGGARFISEVSPGVPIVRLNRAALLAALDRPATMTLGNMVIEPVIQRIAAATGAETKGF